MLSVKLYFNIQMYELSQKKFVKKTFFKKSFEEWYINLWLISIAGSWEYSSISPPFCGLPGKDSKVIRNKANT